MDRRAVLWFEPGVQVCQALGADPWATLASGALLAAFPAPRAEPALQAFAARDQPAAIIGTAEAGSGVDDTKGGQP